MCRHLAYLGPPVPLSRLLYEPEHALVRQTWAPRDMRCGGTINADGFGVGWFPYRDQAWPDDRAGPHDQARPDGGAVGDGARPPAGEEATAVRYRRDCPMWADAELPALAAVTVSTTVLAAARSATAGMPVVHTATAPFTDGRWLFSHNGAIDGWPDSVSAVAGRLPVRDLLTLPAPTDSALLWALVRDRLRAGGGPADAISETVSEVVRAAPASRLNLLLVGAGTAVASTYGHALAWRLDGGAVVLASEPLDADPGWRPVPDRQLVIATTGGVRQSALSLPAGLPAAQPAGRPAGNRPRRG